MAQLGSQGLGRKPRGEAVELRALALQGLFGGAREPDGARIEGETGALGGLVEARQGAVIE